ncbi:tetratricopeptide repeat protein [Thaumasiovibrio subtropicus]|uniref:tetratricopeptide repeat protein n=1 Tax=Thaumasiovibrio subtropicus TaxID=1891207 RepID=UPI000B34AAFD|nr:tetratricopeptide repeat protein [Thaumasiovibrio subtropicus]
MKYLMMGCLLLTGCATTQQNDVDTEQLMGLADTAFKYGQLSSVKSKIDQVLEVDPNHPEAKLMKAKVALREDRPNAAKALLAELVNAQDEVASESALLLGRLALDNQDAASAVQWFEKGLQATPDNAALLNGLGVAKDSLSDFSGAQEYYRQAIAVAPDNKNFRSNLALSLLLSGDIDEAYNELQPLVSRPEVPDYLQRTFALVLIAKGQDDDARNVLLQFMSEDEVDHDMALLVKQLGEAER